MLCKEEIRARWRRGDMKEGQAAGCGRTLNGNGRVRFEQIPEGGPGPGLAGMWGVCSRWNEELKQRLQGKSVLGEFEDQQGAVEPEMQ